MKKYTSIIILIMAFTISNCVSAQVVVGSSSLTGDVTIDDGATFQLKSEDKGLMIPKVLL